MTLSALARRLAVGAAVLFLALGAWSFWLEPDSLRVRDYGLPLRNAAAPLAGLRIAVISDLHAGAPYMNAAKLRRVTAMTDDTHPDLILIAGDIFAQSVVGGHPLPASVTASALAGLRAPLGVYAVLGNHDEGDQAELFREALRSVGIAPLNNQVRKIEVGGQHFWLAGFPDINSGRADVNDTLAQIDDDAPVIGLTHNPQLFTAMPARVNLLIAGHTHGGQVRLGFLSRWVLRTPPHDLTYIQGHYRERSDLFITPGIGTSELPVRFRVPPEISLLTLRQDAPAP